MPNETINNLESYIGKNVIITISPNHIEITGKLKNVYQNNILFWDSNTDVTHIIPISYLEDITKKRIRSKN